MQVRCYISCIPMPNMLFLAFLPLKQCKTTDMIDMVMVIYSLYANIATIPMSANQSYAGTREQGKFITNQRSFARPHFGLFRTWTIPAQSFVHLCVYCDHHDEFAVSYGMSVSHLTCVIFFLQSGIFFRYQDSRLISNMTKFVLS